MSHPLIRLITIVLVCVSSITAQKQSSLSQSSGAPVMQVNTHWYIFRAPDDDFTIEFPAEPQREVDTEGQGGAIRRYKVTNGTMLFQFSYFDTQFDPDSLEGNQLPSDFRQTMSEHARREGWTIIRSQFLYKNVYEQERWTPMDKNPEQKLHFVTRHIRRYGRQYILACSSLIPDKKIDSDACSRFIDSFRILGVPQSQ